MKNALAVASFGSGCFWCTEAIFKQLRGVARVTSGYSGGKIPYPTYQQVCSRTTGHAEAVQITFDPTVISYEQLVEVFFLTHDPTQLNRQGRDVGEQYRSVIFLHNEEQRHVAEAVKQQLAAERIYDKPILTSIEPFTNFYQAEAYHQDYFAKNPERPYYQAIISPKLAKLRNKFSSLLKS